MKNFKGFTLIELLVVVAIIGILSTMAMASFNSAQMKARDAQRRSDLSQIKSALELAKSDTLDGTYPNSESNPSVTTVFSTLQNFLQTKSYMKSVPNDPKSGRTYYYETVGTAPAITDYNLAACLENTNDPKKDAVNYGSCTASVTFIAP